MILLIDNYDSFTYNLFQMLGTLAPDLRVARNDALTVREAAEMQPEGIVISPGPGRPEDAGISEDLVRELRGRIPILGVCLGEQAICQAYGANVGYAKKLMHGKQSETRIDRTSPIFKGLPETIPVARYHSLAVEKETLKGTDLRITGLSDDEEVMAVEDRERCVFGLQFHPESIMTPDGGRILSNFIDVCRTSPELTENPLVK